MRIQSSDEYQRLFPDKDLPDNRVSEALKYALEIRKFEIELYWKRASYFWLLIAAAFTAYFAVSSSQVLLSRRFLVSCIGFILSLGWYLANRGSKYWQENWERHVDVLEDRVIGPLYKTTISKTEFSFYKPHHGYPFSVSKINQLISLYIAVLWGGLACHSSPWSNHLGIKKETYQVVLAVVTLITAISLLLMGIGGSEGKPRSVNFRVSPLAPAGARYMKLRHNVLGRLKLHSIRTCLDIRKKVLRRVGISARQGRHRNAPKLPG